MTREQYRQKYGVEPVLPAPTKVDTTPAPLRMTRAEYEAQYGKPSFSSKVGSAFSSRMSNVATERAKGEAGEQSHARGVLHSAGQVGAFIGDIFGAALTSSPLAPEPGQPSKFNPLAGKESPTGKAIAEKYSQFKAAHPDAAADLEAIYNIGSVLPIGLGGGVATKAAVKVAPEIKTVLKQVNDQRIVNKDMKTVRSIEEELYNIENNYAATRRANDYSNDAGYSSRKRIAETDVLAGSVDIDGKIRTTQPGGAVEKYRALTIDGVEDTVRVNLERLGETINLDQVKRGLTTAVTTSGLEGADLIAALKGVQREIAGLKLRADEFGNIPLYKVHDAKISTTRNINFNTPPETATYRKAVARGYKELVEDTSAFNVREVNKELAKYYKDLEHLKNLDGKGVKGRKLGKYFAQISGNIIGGAAGGAVGGPVGMAVGTIVGGEAAGLIKGRQMAGTFGRPRGAVPPKNPVLEAARQQGAQPGTPNLRVPDKKVGAPSSVPKTPQIHKLENAIEKNIQQQKKAIKAGDFTLVAMLKDAYQELVAALKEATQKARTTPNGFIKNPFGQSSNKDGKRNTQYKKTAAASKSAIGPNTNIVNGAAPAPTGDKGAWPTTASKPSKAGVTSTGNAATGKGGVSAQRAGTSGPFEGPSLKPFQKVAKKSRIGETSSEYEGQIYSVPLKDLHAHAVDELNMARRNVQNGAVSRTDTPVVVTQTPSGKITVLDGQHRVVQALNAGKKDIEVEFIPYKDAIHPDTNFQRTRSLVEADIGVPFVSKSSPSIPKELEPLAAEARKYKSAEEFADYNYDTHFPFKAVEKLTGESYGARSGQKPMRQAALDFYNKVKGKK